MKVLKSYIKERWIKGILLLSFIFIFSFIFHLYDLELEAVLYASVFCAVILVVYLIIDYYRYSLLHSKLVGMKKEIKHTIGNLPNQSSLIMQDYHQLIEELFDLKNRNSNEYVKRNKDLYDYYTLWLHQIKTPIAAMHLILEENLSDEFEILNLELIKIEQYVNMVLTYLRIDSESSDYDFKVVDLDCILKEVIHKFAPFFIHKKIKLDYKNTNYQVLTDEKWLLFVVEQILSNAIKYTKEGTIKIGLKDEHLIIEDSGIGIAKEDLPRVFEKGFTGYNGRFDKKATGLGLYLSNQIIQNLNHKIKIESKLNEGTIVKIDLKRQEYGLE